MFPKIGIPATCDTLRKISQPVVFQLPTNLDRWCIFVRPTQSLMEFCSLATVAMVTWKRLASWLPWQPLPRRKIPTMIAQVLLRYTFCLNLVAIREPQVEIFSAACFLVLLLGSNPLVTRVYSKRNYRKIVHKCISSLLQFVEKTCL